MAFVSAGGTFRRSSSNAEVLPTVLLAPSEASCVCKWISGIDQEPRYLNAGSKIVGSRISYSHGAAERSLRQYYTFSSLIGHKWFDAGSLLPAGNCAARRSGRPNGDTGRLRNSCRALLQSPRAAVDADSDTALSTDQGVVIAPQVPSSTDPLPASGPCSRRHVLAALALAIGACTASDSAMALSESDFKTTDLNVRYADLRVGDGPVITKGAVVRAKLAVNTSGDMLSASATADSETVSFVYGSDPIPVALEVGIKDIKAGTVRRLVIPPELNPDALVKNRGAVFDVEIVSVDQCVEQTLLNFIRFKTCPST